MSKRNASSEPSASASKMQKVEQVDLPKKATIFLAKMMEHHMHKKTVGYEKLRIELGIGHRVKSQLAAWKELKEKGFIEEAEKKDFRLTQKGIDYAATDTYKEYIKDLNIVSLTNEEHQSRIKKYLDAKNKPRTIQIFELLGKYGSLTAKELTALIVCKRGTHKFSNGLRELKDKGYVEADPAASKNKLRLADNAFLTPEDRKKPEAIDPVKLAKLVEDNDKRKKAPKKEKETKQSAKAAKKKAGRAKAPENEDVRVSQV